MTESPSARDESAMSEEEKRSSNALYIGPPQLSLELQATETSVDPVIRPSVTNEGLPVSHQLAVPPAEAAFFRPTQDNPQAAGAEGLGGPSAAQSVAAPVSFSSEVVAPESILPKSTDPNIMQEMTITPPPVSHAFSPPMPVQRPAGVMRTSVQLTFSLEIASLQLTPAFEMRDLQLRSSSQLVTMRLASCEPSQPPINLDVTFEIAKIELENGVIRAIRLLPSDRQRPAVISSSSFAVAGLELETSSRVASVHLARPEQPGASVYLTAGFQIAAIEFSACFGIAAIVLNSISRNASLQLPGAESNPIQDAPVFAIERVEMNGSQLSLIQVTQLGSGKP